MSTFDVVFCFPTQRFSRQLIIHVKGREIKEGSQEFGSSHDARDGLRVDGMQSEETSGGKGNGGAGKANGRR